MWVLRISVFFNLLLGFCPKEIIRKYICVILFIEVLHDVLENFSSYLSQVALTVGMAQLRVIQGETSFEELPRSDWPVGKSVSFEDQICLHC